TVRNCVIGTDETADAIRVDASRDVLLFNNLLDGNDRGIIISGPSTNVQVVNNTIVGTRSTGIVLAVDSAGAPTDALVTNNIIQANGNGLAIQVGTGPPDAQSGYVGDYNLVFEPDAMDENAAYSPDSIRGSNDINSNAQFVAVGSSDFHLGPESG